MQKDGKNIVVIAASTGGPKVLFELFSNLPSLRVAVIIVQHIPRAFYESLAERLNAVSAMRIGVAHDRQALQEGEGYVAPSGVHLRLHRNESVRLYSGEKVNFVCPSADTTMQSLARQSERRLMGIVLTGMGRDGANGIVHMKSLGATNIAQDPSTAAVASMPRAAIETGAVDLVLTPAQIRDKLILFFR